MIVDCWLIVDGFSIHNNMKKRAKMIEMLIEMNATKILKPNELMKILELKTACQCSKVTPLLKVPTMPSE